MTCVRCGTVTVRYTVNQRYCKPCERDVRIREEQDARRGTVRSRYAAVKDLTGSVA